MDANSRIVISSQPGVHPGLIRLLERHRSARWQKPPQLVDQPALDTLDAALDAHSGQLILDSFCGSGASSAWLGRHYPEALVVGVDKSAERLRKAPNLPDNVLLLRAHCEAVWRHLAHRSVRVSRHCLYYPNPWPKPGHLGRRIHGHPAFYELLELSGTIELRSNWQIYVEEFGTALLHNGVASAISVVNPDDAPISLFERKYRASGQVLWQLRARP